MRAGAILRGEGILAITKALLQSGVSYVGGYPGAPVSYLIDVLADANEPLLKPLGIYFEQSGSEAAAAALLGASINYPARGAVTWKSVVGTNVASDALSHVASAGVIGGAVVVIGEDYGEGASILQERTHSTALKSSLPLLDPRNSLESFARFVEEGFGLSEACHQPVLFSIRIRACHMRGTLRCRDNARPKISMLTPLGEPSFSLERINLPPFTYQMEAQKFEKRLPAAQRYIVEHGLNEHHRGDEPDVGIVMQGGLWNTTLRGLHVLGLADTRGRTGCPERPVFSALKILRQREPAVGDTHVAADIGCSTFSTQAPFNVGNSVLGYGMGLASSSAVAPLFGKRTVAVMGDGGFWHNGLTNGVANAMYNRQDSVLVILDNFYAAATGQHHVPSTGTNARNETVRMGIPDALRGLGVKWIRTVNSYRIAEVIGTLREALTTRVPGLKVVIAKNECMLERQRRERPRLRREAAAGRQVVQPRFGVDPDVCTGDHSCMRLNGCPSLTLRESPDPLREDPIAHVDETCVGCGVCGEVAHAAVLCPSFYEVNVIANPTRWTRFVARVRRAVIGRLAAVTA